MQELERRCIGPLEILEHDAERLFCRETTSEIHEAREEPRLEFGCIDRRAQSLASLSIAERGEKNAELVAVAAREDVERGGLETLEKRQEGIGEQRVGNSGLHRVRPADEDRPSIGRRPLRHFHEQSRLPYTTFSADEECSALAFLRRIE